MSEPQHFSNSNLQRKILVVCKYFSYGFGGTPEAVLRTSKGLSEIGVQTDVYAPPGYAENVADLNELPSADSLNSYQRIPRVGCFTAIWIVGAWVPLALFMLVQAKIARVPVTYSPKGQLCRIEFDSVRGIPKLIYFIFVEMLIIIFCNKIIYTSVLERENSIVPRRFIAKSVVIPEVFTGRVGCRRLPMADVGEAIKLGFIAQISERKGLAEFVEGFLKFCGNLPEGMATLAIAGTPLPRYQPAFEKLVNKLRSDPLGQHITFLGQLCGSERSNFYATVDVVVIPSYFESFGLVPMEALAEGCAILVGPDLGILEFLPNIRAIVRLREVSAPAIDEGLRTIFSEWREIRSSRQALMREGFLSFDPVSVPVKLWQALQCDGNSYFKR